MTKPLINWPALKSVPHHIVADTNFNGIETFAPNQLKRIWPTIDVTTGYYAKNPFPNENTVVYNPEMLDENDVALDGLHYMHDNPAYEDLYQDVFKAISSEPEALSQSVYDQTRNDKLSRKLTRKMLKKNKLNSDDLETLIPAVDGFLRRQFAPKYMRSRKKFNYDKLFPMAGELKKSVDNLELFMKGTVLPEVTITSK